VPYHTKGDVRGWNFLQLRVHRPRTTNAPFADDMTRRLAELQAPCDLASHLQRR